VEAPPWPLGKEPFSPFLKAELISTTSKRFNFLPVVHSTKKHFVNKAEMLPGKIAEMKSAAVPLPTAEIQDALLHEKLKEKKIENQALEPHQVPKSFLQKVMKDPEINREYRRSPRINTLKENLVSPAVAAEISH
jgi:hypothetical protein